MVFLFLFLLGLVIGSFLNVLIDRLPNDKSILGRSVCDHCKKTLSWKDLIPVASFVYLRGKCKYCRSPLSFQYPFVELLTCLLFVFTFTFVTQNFQLPITNFQFPIINEFAGSSFYYLFTIIYYLTIVSSLIVIFFADLKYGIIPDEILAVGILATLAYLFMIPNSLFINHLVSAIGAFLFFLLIYALTRARGMGFGDVKLAFLIGLVLGFPGTALALYLAFLTGGIIGIILILWKKKKLKSSIAFGPFLVFGTFLSFFFSPVIIPKILGLLS